MANTIGTTNANVIAQRALEILVADYSFLRNAVTDFSSEAAKYNASVFTHRISATTAQDYSQANGYAATATTQTDVQITLNKFKHVSYSVDDQERTSSNINLIERFAGGPVGIEAIAHTMSSAPDTLEDDVEPFLLRCELVVRTPRGRRLTPRGEEHLGTMPKIGPQGRLF